MKWLPCGVYHEYYSRDHAFWQTSFVRGKMILTALIVFVLFPLSDVIFPYFGPYFINVLIVLIYTILAAMGGAVAHRVLRPGYVGGTERSWRSVRIQRLWC